MQVLEFLAPVTFEYVSAGHREHINLPMSSRNLPGMQSEQTWFKDALLDKYDPAAHVLFLQKTFPVSGWYSPTAQGEQTWLTEALPEKYDPAAHVLFTQDALPVSV